MAFLVGVPLASASHACVGVSGNDVSVLCRWLPEQMEDSGDGFLEEVMLS